MSVQELMARLAGAGVQVRRDGDRLVLSGRTEALDPALLAELRARKDALLAVVERVAGEAPPASFRIRPDMLPLVDLTQDEIDRIVAGVEGGAANVQDIYPLAPLQDGILFHYLMTREGDPYLVGVLYRFDSREGLDRYLAALQAVVDRHDVLRTAVVWEGLREPVQVVWRRAPLPVEEVRLDPAAGPAGEQLYARFDPRHHRVDVRTAPILRACVARDPDTDGWLLLFLRHHLITDHTTQEVLQSEIQAHLAGRADALPRPLPFRTYVAQTRLGVSRDEHRAFFTDLLGDVDEPTAPFGLLDARGDGSEMDEALLFVQEGLAARLRERARAAGVSAASVFHVAWAQLLARASGRSDVVFGTVLFGRMHGGEGSERVMGPFINTLPVRVRVGDQGVEATVRQTHALLARVLRHEHASLALAQRCSRVEAPAPLFTALLNYRHSGRKLASDADTAAARTAVGGMKRLHAQERTTYPLTLSVDDVGDRFRLKAQVMCRELDPARVCGLMHRALEVLVQALETAPERAVGALDVLPEDERARVVEEWNHTDAEYPADACVHELFETQAERTPDAVAVVFAGDHLTYAELNRRANRLAHHLRERGVGPDVRVALCLERSVEAVVAQLAVLKAGGAYVPLDPDYPAERLRYMLHDSAPALALTQARLRALLVGAEVPVLAVDTAAHAWAGAPEANPGHGEAGAKHLACVLYTSGSTGRPKGVMISHRAVVNRLAWMHAYYRLRPHDPVLHKTSLNFDISLWEVFWPLTVGARLELARPGGQMDAGYLVETIRRAGVATVHFVPSMLQFFLEHPGASACAPPLRWIACSGEALTPALLQRFRECFPALPLHNQYGPTEAGEVTVSACLPGGRADVPIGAPVWNTRVYVLDERGQPAPVGVAGELFLAGDQVARGYQGRPELTAERFVADPFARGPGARMYRTGDLARWTPEGVLEYLGRNDHQVKIRGFRVELPEIEARLAEHPDVREAVVVAREDAPGDTRLVAYWVGGGADAETLRAHLAEALPAYMVPAAYVWLEQLPLTPNGKLDRRALPAPESDAYARRGYEAPVGQTEQALADIWSEVLGVERVGRWDDFFELGGHSLLAVQVFSRVQQVLGVEVELADLFDRPVLSDFARGLETAARAELPPIEPADRAGRVPLSFAQQRLWFLEQLGSASGAYSIRRRLRLRGELDRGALLRALEGIVARHEALRTTFAQVDGAPEQRIAPAGAAAFGLLEHDLSGHPDAKAGLARLIADEVRAPFDLERGPLIRGRLIRLAPDDHVLLLTMHHMVSDGWSTGVFLGEFSALYAAHREGREAELPELPVQYADYAVWQRRWVEGEVLREQAEYWARTLAGAPELLELPADRPRPARMDHAGTRFGVVLDEELTAGLKALSLRHGTTLFMTLLAGWAAVLGRLSGQDDVVVGSPTAGRGRREIEGLIGFFINTLALRVDLSGSPTVAGLLARVKERVLGAQRHQDIPFEQVVERVDPARSMAHGPLFQVMFTWQNTPRGDGLRLPGLSVSEMEAPEQTTAKVDLSLALSERNGRIRGTVTYATALFDRETVERQMGYLRRVLAGMVADDGQRVERLALLTADERARVVEEWNRTEAEYPRESCIHELFEARAARAPGAVAVVSADGERVTYADLNARANRLAHHLRARGVGPGVRVGLCVERSPAMVVGVLAVLKAGGVFVPLDPGYPRERLEYMLADSAPAAVLTRGALARELAEVFAALGGGVPVLELDAAVPEWADQPETNPERGALTPAHPAYVTYTSGSTGRPKGVPAVHHRVLNLIHWYGREFGITERDAVLLVMSFSFDGTYRNLFAPLFAGGQLHLASEPFDPAAIVAQIASAGISTINLTPTAFQALVQADRGGALAGMRTVILVGEPVQPRKLLELPEPRPALVNLYGPTECSGIMTFHRLSADLEEYRERPVPAGRPIPNGRVYILDRAGGPVPVGAAGELYIGGTPVGPGYQNRAAQTAERFVPDPFAGRPGARMYRTGDRARWLADGTVELLGRMDFQVKVRGYRVEPGEIEARLREHPGVREAVVVAREDTPGEPRLVAYVVGDAAAGADVLRAHLGRALPDYMVPSAYVRLERLPLTPNGKLDRTALPAPEADAYAAREYEAPVDETEQELAAIWAQVLGVERVGRHDHFFELGGHSLLAVQVISRVRTAMEVKVALGDLFTRPVLKDFAQQIVDAQLAQVDPDAIAQLLAMMRESTVGSGSAGVPREP